MAQNEFFLEVGVSSRKSVREEKMPYDNADPAKKELGQKRSWCSNDFDVARGGGIGIFRLAMVA